MSFSTFVYHFWEKCAFQIHFRCFLERGTWWGYKKSDMQLLGWTRVCNRGFWAKSGKKEMGECWGKVKVFKRECEQDLWGKKYEDEVKVRVKWNWADKMPIWGQFWGQSRKRRMDAENRVILNCGGIRWEQSCLKMNTMWGVIVLCSMFCLLLVVWSYFST